MRCVIFPTMAFSIMTKKNRIKLKKIERIFIGGGVKTLKFPISEKMNLI